MNKCPLHPPNNKGYMNEKIAFQRQNRAVKRESRKRVSLPGITEIDANCSESGEELNFSNYSLNSNQERSNESSTASVSPQSKLEGRKDTNMDLEALAEEVDKYKQRRRSHLCFTTPGQTQRFQNRSKSICAVLAVGKKIEKGIEKTSKRQKGKKCKSKPDEPWPEVKKSDPEAIDCRNTEHVMRVLSRFYQNLVLRPSQAEMDLNETSAFESVDFLSKVTSAKSDYESKSSPQTRTRTNCHRPRAMSDSVVIGSSFYQPKAEEVTSTTKPNSFFTLRYSAPVSLDRVQASMSSRPRSFTTFRERETRLHPEGRVSFPPLTRLGTTRGRLSRTYTS